MNDRIKKAIERNKVVSEFLGCISLGNLRHRLDFKTATITLNRYSVGALHATQQTISPNVYDKIERGVWNAPSNKFFTSGQQIDFTKERILVVYQGGLTPKYVAAGHTRAKYLLDNKSPQAEIPAISVQDPSVQDFIQDIQATIGRKRISDL